MVYDEIVTTVTTLVGVCSPAKGLLYTEILQQVIWYPLCKQNDGSNYYAIKQMVTAAGQLLRQERTLLNSQLLYIWDAHSQAVYDEIVLRAVNSRLCGLFTGVMSIVHDKMSKYVQYLHGKPKGGSNLRLNGWWSYAGFCVNPEPYSANPPVPSEDFHPAKYFVTVRLISGLFISLRSVVSHSQIYSASTWHP